LSKEDTHDATTGDYDVAARLAGEFFIRGVEIIARAHDGDLLRGNIFTAIAVPNHQGPPGGTDNPPAPPVRVP